MSPPTAHVISGGTHFHVRPHLSLAAPAYGATGRKIQAELEARGCPAALHLTAMAGGSRDLDTNDDVAALVRAIVADPAARLLFLPVALCDFTAAVLDDAGAPTPSGKREPRLATSEGAQTLALTPAAKVIRAVRRERKDLFLVGFKTTAGASPAEQFARGLELLKTASCNLVLANDLHTRANMIVTPEQASYHATDDRDAILRELCDMALLRSRLSFTRSTVVPGDPVPWSSDLVPAALRRVVDHCIARGAYKPFLGATVGHFAVKIGEGRPISTASPRSAWCWSRRGAITRSSPTAPAPRSAVRASASCSPSTPARTASFTSTARRGPGRACRSARSERSSAARTSAARTRATGSRAPAISGR
jgi:hypothetical protein